VSQGVSTALTVYPARLDASLNFVEAQALRAGATASVDVLSSNLSVGTITGSPAALAGGSASATAQFNASNPGSTTLSLNIRAGFSIPAQGASKLTAGVTSAGLIPANVAVGNKLETAANILLNGVAPPGGLVITLSSSDTNKLRFSNTANAPGTDSITVPVQGNQSTSLDFFVQGLGSSGTVTYTATAPGFGMNTGTVTLQP